MSVVATNMNTINHLSSTTCKLPNLLQSPIRFDHKPFSYSLIPLLPKTLNGFSYSSSVSRRSRFIIPKRQRLSVSVEWQDCSVKMEVDVPVSVAYNFYLDRESFPKWMPFISSVEVLKDKPDLSRWSLKYNAFGQDIKYSWLARNLQPTPNQKIHWRSLEGLPNKGSVRFFPKGPSSCIVELTVSYEVPALLTPVASALRPFLERLLRGGLERFATMAKTT
ncbi:PREDICTED: uncharacterized protein LOC104754221 isoform X1 [Camelina sativa]|uniref:Uncharacterized protein LOC104754221 isoform X1 n=1 Tax=Camelina sativa TaxID=90675 RepID=A0ABM1R5P5_CAMSA|nr:PREDICTED: uncharacterized protein LOC104754221 isoform X1 [Camelina sativa]XP_019094333.1 PREDICTED: uncharacterized protein LOC104754221 isoform X1 [Camelina sativa]